MTRRTPRPAAKLTATLTLLRETCEQCGKRLWVVHRRRQKMLALEGHRPTQSSHLPMSYLLQYTWWRGSYFNSLNGAHCKMFLHFEVYSTHL
jgi:hypothetical protein